MEETASVTRISVTCLVVWSGDHRLRSLWLKSAAGIKGRVAGLELPELTRGAPACSHLRKVEFVTIALVWERTGVKR